MWSETFMRDFEPTYIAEELAEIWAIQSEIGDTRAMSQEDVKRRLKQLLDKVKEAATTLKPDGITVQVGFPLGASVSLSWNTEYSERY